MKLTPLSIEGAWRMDPRQHSDDRGMFLEWYRSDLFADAAGHPLRLAQANLARSARNVLRGVHFAQVPPGQAKYVICVSGEIVDVVVDVRVGSPTFGQWEAVRLDDTSFNALYLGEGLGHAYCVLSESAVVAYLCSEGYQPGREFTVSPLDPQLAIDWPTGSPILSPRDAEAPTLAEAAAAGILPVYADCMAYTTSLRSR
ncbi:dTDP-4-dehydrorhamnose 3,5-epimerase [Catellatospora sichuanensis]|uniref:dTDP-4-dehydrorhamnose 3,5-epimerase n=1 Tax=Catellatospora sichuanensis TaxID=1969805 RepID=UPI0011838265|nr:dTDP-4-dehydrorhamnose 3,5-epimerase [Catellatospora sichuanensis]